MSGNLLIQNKTDEIVSYHIPRNILLIHGDEPGIEGITDTPQSVPYDIYIIEAAKQNRIFIDHYPSYGVYTTPGKFGTAHAMYPSDSGWALNIEYKWDAPIWPGAAYDPGLFNFGDGPWTVDLWAFMEHEGWMSVALSYDYSGDWPRPWLSFSFGASHDANSSWDFLSCRVINKNLPIGFGPTPPEAIDTLVDVDSFTAPHDIPITTGVWHHVAIVCEKIADTSPTNRVRAYWDGGVVGEALTDLDFKRRTWTNESGDYKLPHAAATSPMYDTAFLIDELRITRRAVWTENFTPPTEPYNPPTPGT